LIDCKHQSLNSVENQSFMKQVCLVMLLILMGSSWAMAQTKEPLRGQVSIESGEPLIGATIRWDGTQIGTLTDTTGRFTITRPDTTASIVIRFIGLDDQKVEILPDEQDVYIEVKNLPAHVLEEVRIQAKQFDNSISLLSMQNVESINS
jgi:hypothetical protein